MEEEKRKISKLILNIPDELNKEYKNLAKKMGISRNAMILYAMSYYINYSKTLDILPDFIKTLQKEKNK